MKSYMAKTSEVDRKWYVIDAEDQVLGRLSSEVSKILSGKNKPTYTPHLDTGDFVIIINADKIKVTGNKRKQESIFYHTGYPGGDRFIPYDRLLSENPEKLIHMTVKGMLPKSSLGRKMIRKLKVYSGSEHNHQAQQPEVYEL